MFKRDLDLDRKWHQLLVFVEKNIGKKPYIEVDSKAYTDNLNNLPKESIKHIKVIANKKAIELYGDKAKDGAILVAKYGKGNYIYTGISFFRELPEGVPGAFRLLANMIAIGK